MAERDTKHGTLDADAGARLDELLAMARVGGYATTPGLMMSNAVRVYYALATGAANLTWPNGEAALPAVGDGTEARPPLH